MSERIQPPTTRDTERWTWTIAACEGARSLVVDCRREGERHARARVGERVLDGRHARSLGSVVLVEHGVDSRSGLGLEVDELLDRRGVLARRGSTPRMRGAQQT